MTNLVCSHPLERRSVPVTNAPHPLQSYVCSWSCLCMKRSRSVQPKMSSASAEIVKTTKLLILISASRCLLTLISFLHVNISMGFNVLMLAFFVVQLSLMYSYMNHSSALFNQIVMCAIWSTFPINNGLHHCLTIFILDCTYENPCNFVTYG